MKINQQEWYAINTIIAKIYKEKASTVLMEVCKELKAIIPFDAAFTNLTSNQNDLIQYFHYEAIGIDDDHMNRYINHYVDVDYCAWYTAQPKASVYRDTQLIYEDKRIESIFYTEWLAPIQLHFACGMSIAANETAYGDLTLLRKKESGDFTDTELEILDVINGHLSQFFATQYPAGISKTSFDKHMTDLQIKYNLTEKENEIVQYIKEGVEIKNLHKILVISDNTVKKHLANIYTKLNVNNRSQFIKTIYIQD